MPDAWLIHDCSSVRQDFKLRIILFLNDQNPLMVSASTWHTDRARIVHGSCGSDKNNCVTSVTTVTAVTFTAARHAQRGKKSFPRSKRTLTLTFHSQGKNRRTRDRLFWPRAAYPRVSLGLVHLSQREISFVAPFSPPRRPLSSPTLFALFFRKLDYRRFRALENYINFHPTAPKSMFPRSPQSYVSPI